MELRNYGAIECGSTQCNVLLVIGNMWLVSIWFIHKILYFIRSVAQRSPTEYFVCIVLVFAFDKRWVYCLITTENTSFIFVSIITQQSCPVSRVRVWMIQRYNFFLCFSIQKGTHMLGLKMMPSDYHYHYHFPSVESNEQQNNDQHIHVI